MIDANEKRVIIFCSILGASIPILFFIPYVNFGGGPDEYMGMWNGYNLFGIPYGFHNSRLGELDFAVTVSRLSQIMIFTTGILLLIFGIIGSAGWVKIRNALKLNEEKNKIYYIAKAERLITKAKAWGQFILWVHFVFNVAFFILFNIICSSSFYYSEGVGLGFRSGQQAGFYMNFFIMAGLSLICCLASIVSKKSQK